MCFLINVVEAGKAAVLVYCAGCLSAHARVCMCVFVKKTTFNVPQTQKGTKRLLVCFESASQNFQKSV